MELFANIIGLVGVICVVGSYVLMQTQKILSSSFSYNFFNLLGASLILYSLIYDFNFPSFCIQVIWIIASLIGLYRSFQGTLRSKKNLKKR